MTVNQLIDELTKAKEAGCGNIGIRESIPFLYINGNQCIVEDKDKFDSRPFELTADAIIETKKRKCFAITIGGNYNYETPKD